MSDTIDTFIFMLRTRQANIEHDNENLNPQIWIRSLFVPQICKNMLDKWNI